MASRVSRSLVQIFIDTFKSSKENYSDPHLTTLYSTEIIKRTKAKQLNTSAVETELLEHCGITLQASCKLQLLLRSLRSKEVLRHYTDLLAFFLLLKREDKTDTSGRSSLPIAISRVVLGQTNNNMAGYPNRTPEFGSNQSTWFNGDGPASRGYVSGSQTPASLWGAPSTSTTYDRGVGSNRSVRHPDPSKSLSPNTLYAEKELLREAILCLTGASGTLIHYNTSRDAFVPASNIVLPARFQTRCLRITVCGWLHNRLRQFIQTVREDSTSGKVTTSLAMSVDDQLTEYYRLVSTIEAQLNQIDQSDQIFNSTSAAAAPTTCSTQYITTTSSSSLSLLQGGQGDAGPERQTLTLRTLSHWLMDPKRRLKLLASLVDICAPLKGGALVSKVYQMAKNGEPPLRSLLKTVLVRVTQPISDMIALWIYDGRLATDTNHEFFIAVNPSAGNASLWYEKYGIRKAMVPSFISEDQASKILLIGKSVNFLVHVCGDSNDFKDIEAIRKTRLQRVESIYNQVSDPSFDLMISTAYNHVSKRLLGTLMKDYHFIDHLTAMRKFLLLGQGDFIQRLMDLLEPLLGQSADSLHRHTLNEVLETAIRDTNAQYEDPEILQRLQVELLEIAEGDNGWDVFSLEYVVSGPLATIFSPDCRLYYLKAFSFLWRLKRMEFILSALWREQLVVARLPHGLADDLTPILHAVQLLGAEIRHFIQQLQFYVNFEALECAWVDLGKKIGNANDLDEVIRAHQDFLSGIMSRCLLDAGSSHLRYQLRAIFDVLINFSQLSQDLQDWAKQELDTRVQWQHGIDATTKTGQWGTCNTPESQEVARRQNSIEHTISALIARIRVLGSSYREMVAKFVSMLQEHTDQSLRILAQNLDVNVYAEI